MRIALLFDELGPHRYHAGHTAREAVLRPGILQASGRLLIIRSGTVLLNHARPERRGDLIQETFFGDNWSNLDRVRVALAARESRIFAWAIDNVDQATASALQEALAQQPTYLGMHSIDLTLPSHCGLYRSSLPLALRILGNRCNVFFYAAEGDGRDHAKFDHLLAMGFSSVEWEDLGLRDTVFDEYDSPAHFARLESLRTVVKLTQSGGADDVDELMVLLDDLSPRLAVTLAVACESFLQASSDEHLAQVGLSLRRYVEQLANLLFPARQELVAGREVTQPRVKNRLRAYVETVRHGGRALKLSR